MKKIILSLFLLVPFAQADEIKIYFKNPILSGVGTGGLTILPLRTKSSQGKNN